MPDTTYRIIYEGIPDAASKGIDKLIADLAKLETAIGKVNAKVKTIGADTSGLTKLMGVLKSLDTELKTKVTDANKVEKALVDVGKGNRSVTELTTRLKALETQLEAVSVASLAAKNAGAGVGAGGVGPGGVAAPGATPAAIAARPGMGRVMTGVAIGTGVMAGRAAFGAVARAGNEERGFLEESAGKVNEFREGLREYAGLRNEPGPNDKIVREALAFAKEGGVLPDEITPYLTQYEGSSATGRQKGNIGGQVGVGGYTREMQEKLEAQLKVRGALFATRVGLDAKTAGDLTGVVSTYKKLTSEADLAGQLGGMYYGLAEGRGEITPLARSELGQAGSAIESGRVSGLPELGAFVGVASIVSKMPGSSGTTYGQISRLLNEVGGDKGDFLKEAGVADKKGDFAKFKALRDHLAKVKPDDPNAYLDEKGFGNSTDRRSVLGVIGNLDVLEARIKKANAIAASGQETIAKDAANESEMATVNRRGATAEFTSQIELGLRSEKLAQGKAFARARMSDPNQPGGQRLKAEGSTIFGDMFRYVTGAGMSGEEQRVNAEAIAGLVKGGKQVNVDVARNFPDMMNNLRGKIQEPQQFQADYARAAAMVESAGGDPFGGAPERLGTALRRAADAADAFGQQGRPGPGMPPPPGVQGAGFNPGRR
jgi:hypothetical protein